MLLPGYHVVMRDITLQSDDRVYKIRLYQDDWITTNGTVLGRFDKKKLLDWLPLEWTNGHVVTLNERLSTQLEVWSKQVAFGFLEKHFDKLVYMPDAPLPDMPRPPIRNGLGTYLRTRRTMTAGRKPRSEYDFR